MKFPREGGESACRIGRLLGGGEGRGEGVKKGRTEEPIVYEKGCADALFSLSSNTPFPTPVLNQYHLKPDKRERKEKEGI